MPFYEVSCGTGVRTYGAVSKQHVAEHLFGEQGRQWEWKYGGKAAVRVLGKPGHERSYTIEQVPKEYYDAARRKDGDIVGDSMDLRKDVHERQTGCA